MKYGDQPHVKARYEDAARRLMSENDWGIEIFDGPHPVTFLGEVLVDEHGIITEYGLYREHELGLHDKPVTHTCPICMGTKTMDPQLGEMGIFEDYEGTTCTECDGTGRCPACEETSIEERTED